MRHPLPEAYELVEDGHITADNFRDFTFANAVKLWGTQNPRFFEGTRVAKEAAVILAARKPQPSPPPNNPAPQRRLWRGCPLEASPKQPLF